MDILADSRSQARERMWREACARGANAVVATRFDCNKIGDIMSEVAAYGTGAIQSHASRGARNCFRSLGRPADNSETVLVIVADPACIPFK